MHVRGRESGELSDFRGRQLRGVSWVEDASHKLEAERGTARSRERFAGEHPSPLEVLLAERIASLWVLVEMQEALLSATYRRGQEKPVGPAYVIQMCKIQESANRRYLAAIKTLAQVRKLQANTLAVQVNTQINIGEGR